MREVVRLSAVSAPVWAADGATVVGELGMGSTADGHVVLRLKHADGSHLTALLSIDRLNLVADAVAAALDAAPTAPVVLQ